MTEIGTHRMSDTLTRKLERYGLWGIVLAIFLFCFACAFGIIGV